jgi:hypothetical protein
MEYSDTQKLKYGIRHRKMEKKKETPAVVLNKD